MNSFVTSPAACLHEEQQAVRALTQLLMLEQEELIQANTEAVASLTAPKAQAAAAISQLSQQRYQALASAGFDANDNGMQAWVESGAASKEASDHWHQLIDLAKTAHEVNRVNGTLINKQIIRTQNALNVLQHGSVQGNNLCYGPDGQTSSAARGRHIVAG